MKYLISPGSDGWMVNTLEDADDSLVIQYSISETRQRGFPPRISQKSAIRYLKELVQKEADPWIVPQHKEWIFDLNKLSSRFSQLTSVSWLKEKVHVEPEFEVNKPLAEMEAFWKISGQNQYLPPVEEHLGILSFTVVPELVRGTTLLAESPPEIHESLASFQMDFPNSQKVAFIIMRFGETRAHTNIREGIKETLHQHDIAGICADEKQYHDDLFHNVLTYMHGCGFGIAVFERIEEESFNPNISLEVGYMIALRKPVCILKDRTLKTLHSDLVGRLYRTFDPIEPRDTISKELAPWLRDKRLG